MRLGILVRDDNTGLGYQTRSYVKHLNPSKIVNIDLSILNGNAQNGWYPNTETIIGIPTNEQVQSILSDIDVLLTAETPYNLNLYTMARQMGVKTVCVENPEFYDHIKYPMFEMPDLIILPSVWKEQEIREHAESRGTKVVQLHHPVDRDEITYLPRTTKNFIHIAGKPAANDRNGTWTFLEACYDGIITTQSDDLMRNIATRHRHVTIYNKVLDNNVLYQLGDILVLPRRYGGNCLVLNEALAAGMPVIMPDISPNNNLLPKEWLVPAFVSGHFEPRTPVEIYDTDIAMLRQKLEWFKQQDITALSKQASDIADTISWTTLLPAYINAIESIL